MSTLNEKSNVSEPQIFDPFPKPQTMPSGWDLSEFTPDPVPATVEPVNDLTDTSTP